MDIKLQLSKYISNLVIMTQLNGTLQKCCHLLSYIERGVIQKTTNFGRVRESHLVY